MEFERLTFPTLESLLVHLNSIWSVIRKIRISQQ